MKNPQPTTVEIKLIKAMTSLFENKYTLSPENIMVHGFGYIGEFYLSNGENYIVKVYDDDSKPKIFKLLE